MEGGKGGILTRADLTAEQKSVARGFLLDPGGDNISPEITGDWKRNHHEEGQGAPAREGPLKDPGGQHAPAREGKIKDPGGGEDIDIRGWQMNFEKCVDR